MQVRLGSFVHMKWYTETLILLPYCCLTLGGEPITELDAVLESMTQFTQDLLNLALNSVKEQDVLKSSYMQVSKVNTPSAHNSVPAIEE